MIGVVVLDNIKSNGRAKPNDIPRIPVQASPPYPPITVEGRNISYAQILSSDFAGSKGEMSAIYQYIYQSWILQEQHPLISETLLRIAKVEMQHLNILGQLTIKLGGNPKCQFIQNRRSIVWNGSMVNYTQNLQEMLKANMADEQYAADMYMRHATMIQDGDISALLARLSLDELQHKSIVEGFLEQISETKTV